MLGIVAYIHTHILYQRITFNSPNSCHRLVGSLLCSRRCAAIAVGLMALGTLYAVYLARQRTSLSEPEVSSLYK